MKKIHTTMIVGLMAGIVLLAGCKREYGTVTLGANIDNGRDAKVYIDNLTPCWHNNDLIRVNNQTCTTSAALGPSAQITDVVESNHYRAIYPADIVGNVDISSSNTIAVTLPSVQQYEVDSRGDQKVKVPMGAYSSSESLTFHNLCSLIKVVISNRTNNDFVLDYITVIANTAYLSGQGVASITGSSTDMITMTDDESPFSKDVSLAFTTDNRPTIGRGDRDTYVYYIVVPAFAQDNVSITLFSANGQYATFEKTGVSLQHNKIATVNLIVEQWNELPNPPSDNGMLPALFSVSDTRQVRFSQGNLQYQASTGTWRFAENQWDYVGSQSATDYGRGTVSGSDNANISSSYGGWIDLFGWGTSGWNSGANCYQPWSTSRTNSDYYTGGTNSNSLTGAYSEADWAWHNAISNGGNTAHLWRILTTFEWNYLINYRTDADNKCGYGIINGIRGLIILPDSWTLPAGCSFNSGFAWTNNNYILAQWRLMEAAGAVFLPAAGIRDGMNFWFWGGCYWSSWCYCDFYYNYTNEFYYGSTDRVLGLKFSSGVLMPEYSEDRYYGFSVRPVR